MLAGNAALYGATSGRLFLAGRAGERFAVRNSGAAAVVEGVGDHGCEYMTGGAVVVLGSVGRNFGAGMSGGVAYAFDEERSLTRRLNPERVETLALDAADEGWLLEALERHVEATGSPVAARILDRWSSLSARFLRVSPRGLPRILGPAWSECEPVASSERDDVELVAG